MKKYIFFGDFNEEHCLSNLLQIDDYLMCPSMEKLSIQKVASTCYFFSTVCQDSYKWETPLAVSVS